jgi:hypothetical protein
MYPPGSYFTQGTYLVPVQTGYPTVSQPVNRATQVLSNAPVFSQQPVNFGAVVVPSPPPAYPVQQAYHACQAVLAYQAFQTQMAQQSVADQPQYIRFVGTPEDIARLRQELERGRPVRFVQQAQGGPSRPLNEIGTQPNFTAALPMISDHEEATREIAAKPGSALNPYEAIDTPQEEEVIGAIIRQMSAEPASEQAHPAEPPRVAEPERQVFDPVERDFEWLDRHLNEAGVLDRVKSGGGALRVRIVPLTKEQLIKFSSAIVRYADLAVCLGKPALDDDQTVKLARRFAEEQNREIL